tara:strand:- start:10154 stop:10954 length:801 start_codon:yes stop_codon:yes gene_type:complete
MQGYTMPTHAHEDHAMLLFPLMNTMTVQDSEMKIERPLEPHFFYFVDSGIYHQTKSKRAHQEHLAVYLNSDWKRNILRQLDLNTEMNCHAGIWKLTETASDLTRIVARDIQITQPQKNLKPFERVMELLAESCLTQIQTTAPTFVGHPREHGSVLVCEVLEHIRGNLSEPLSLDLLAEHFGISRRHLTRLFRQYSGQSIGTILREERFTQAAILLRETDWSIQQIAVDVGIGSSANFASGFKRQFGNSPTGYRGAIRLTENQMAQI